MKLIALLFLFLFLMPVSAHCDTNGDKLFRLVHFGETNYFELECEPGCSGNLSFTLFNDSETRMTNHLMIYDSLSAVNGGNIIMTPEDYTASGTARWFEDNVLNITLEPGENISMTIGYYVPEDTAPGLHTAILGLFADESADSLAENEDGKDIGLVIKNRYTSTLAIVIKTNGNPYRKLELGEGASLQTEAETGRCYLFVPVHNKGDAYDFPEISVRVYAGSESLFVESMKMDIVYARTETQACFDVTGAIDRPGKYRAIASVTGAGECSDSKSYNVRLGSSEARDMVEGELGHQVYEGESDFSKGFVILGKRQLAWGSAIAVLLVFLLIGGFMLIRRNS